MNYSGRGKKMTKSKAPKLPKRGERAKKSKAKSKAKRGY
jgi:hypothetical protein